MAGMLQLVSTLHETGLDYRPLTHVGIATSRRQLASQNILYAVTPSMCELNNGPPQQSSSDRLRPHVGTVSYYDCASLILSLRVFAR